MPAVLIAVAYAAIVLFGTSEALREAAARALGVAGMTPVLLAALAAWALMLTRPLASADAHCRINDRLHPAGQALAVLALAVMVLMILGQVFFRYVLNDAPNWTEEGARFCMIWMTGLMAPIAYRRGGFVAIDMLERALARTAATALSLLLLAISLWVLLICWDKGWNNHVDSLSGRGDSSSLRLPLDWFGGQRVKFQNNWQYAGLWTGVNLLILVNAELVLRQVVTLLGGGERLRPLAVTDMPEAE